MPPKVYYLDDEELLAKHFQRYLTAKGMDVRVFGDALAAIEACRSDPPDLLFIDYRLADTTGDKVAQAVDRDILKVLVTGDLSSSTGDHFCAVVHKPFSLKAVCELVSELLAGTSD